MNSDMLLNRIRMAQQGLIGVHKKLYTLEHLLPSPDPAQFAETAKSAALLSERSTASLRGFLFTTTGGMPEGYYQQAAAAQGIKVSATDDYVFVKGTQNGLLTASRLQTSAGMQSIRAHPGVANRCAGNPISYYAVNSTNC